MRTPVEEKLTSNSSSSSSSIASSGRSRQWPSRTTPSSSGPQGHRTASPSGGLLWPRCEPRDVLEWAVLEYVRSVHWSGVTGAHLYLSYFHPVKLKTSAATPANLPDRMTWDETIMSDVIDLTTLKTAGTTCRHQYICQLSYYKRFLTPSPS